MREFILIVILIPILALIDYVWLGLIAKSFYTRALGDLMRPAGAALDPRLIAAILVYLLLALGIVFFVLPHAGGSILATLLWGALFGLVVYGVYDLTNIAILARWPFSVVVVDIIWGAVFMAGSSLIALYISRLLL